jgi:hypothetical protein
MLHRVVWQKFPDVSEVLAASIIRARMMEATITSETSVNFYQTTKLNIRVLMMEAASTSETSVNFCQTTRRNIPEVSHLHSHRCEDLKSQNVKISVFILIRNVLQVITR